jgi:hypothetical protein
MHRPSSTVIVTALAHITPKPPHPPQKKQNRPYLLGQPVRGHRHLGVLWQRPFGVGGLPLRVQGVEEAEEEPCELEGHLLVRVCVCA